ncbi:MAG: hypothetical protein ACOY3K_05120 [Candidatus Omnitrophota bacterium]
MQRGNPRQDQERNVVDEKIDQRRKRKHDEDQTDVVSRLVEGRMHRPRKSVLGLQMAHQEKPRPVEPPVRRGAPRGPLELGFGIFDSAVSEFFFRFVIDRKTIVPAGVSDKKGFPMGDSLHHFGKVPFIDRPVRRFPGIPGAMAHQSDVWDLVGEQRFRQVFDPSVRHHF